MNQSANPAGFEHGATQAAEGFPRLAWTLAEFERLSDQGYFGGIDRPRERVELVSGELVPMSAKGARHELLRTELADAFARKLPPRSKTILRPHWIYLKIHQICRSPGEKLDRSYGVDNRAATSSNL